MKNYIGAFISLINTMGPSIQCDTCLETIKINQSFIIDCKDDSTYCNSDCLAHSFEFNLIPSLPY
jgi:hypothetical protein